ncbi:hypothetical protein [Thalassoglobus sp.]|uniref:hypothetical protein n=1 Tax=Thalassoglobus sp. TaxID=2795869 RepID=UPI003AA88CEB
MSENEGERDFENERLNRELRLFALVKADLEKVNHKITTGYLDDLDITERSLLLNGFGLFCRIVKGYSEPIPPSRQHSRGIKRMIDEQLCRAQLVQAKEENELHVEQAIKRLLNNRIELAELMQRIGTGATLVIHDEDEMQLIRNSLVLACGIVTCRSIEENLKNV